MYSNQLEGMVAKVDGQKITQQEFNTVLNQIRMQQRLQSGDQSTLSSIELKQLAMQSIVSSVLLSRAATRDGFYIDPLLIESAIATMPAFQENGKFSSERFNNMLNALLYSQQQFFDQVGQQILSNQIQQGIIQTDFSLPKEVDRAIQLVQQKRDFDYVTIPAKRFMADIKPTEKEQQDYYQQHLDQFKVPEKVSVDYLELSLGDLMKKDSKKAQDQFSNLSDQLVNITYENPDSLKEAAKELNLQIKTTPLFTAEGDKTGMMSNPKFVQAAFSDTVLAQGNNSDLINVSDTEVVVLRIHEHQEAGEKPLDSVRPQIIEALCIQGAQLKAEAMGQKIISLIDNGQPLCKTAQQFGLACAQSGYVALTNKTIMTPILMAAFKMPRPLKEAARTNIGTALPSGDYAVLSLKGIQYEDPSLASPGTLSQMSRMTATSLGSMNYQLYLKNLHDRAKIVDYTNTSESGE
jgi:hypothetical protein